MLFIVIEAFFFVLLAIAFLTVAERKLLASVQRRRGPSVVGMFGVLQAFADGLKLVFKELVIPSNANTILYSIAPMYTLFCMLVAWYVFPFSTIEITYSLVWLLCISALSVLGIIVAGWASNSKYAFLGGIRSAAQLLAYELCLSILYGVIIGMVGDSSIGHIVEQQTYVWFILPLFPLWTLFIIIILAETNRAPFDLPEAEAELVAGYNVEYGSILFAMFFLGEYGNMLVMSCIGIFIFFGGWLPGSIYVSSSLFFCIKVIVHVSIFVWVRAAFPRYRYDQLLSVGWKVLLPAVFGCAICCFMFRFII